MTSYQRIYDPSGALRGGMPTQPWATTPEDRHTPGQLRMHYSAGQGAGRSPPATGRDDGGRPERGRRQISALGRRTEQGQHHDRDLG
ncbi:hypothetical protein Asi03nite_22760 [Actinoplanes siamensis]|uniref:Uncharacterized protein n=1 Tax=Actinoplanes siamensis TaxID=1223317 RepID=A0A919N5C8_9ACTN|nr:hypothetical protein Asi03nite_22760 [Actinoplanes siamensis]